MESEPSPNLVDFLGFLFEIGKIAITAPKQDASNEEQTKEAALKIINKSVEVCFPAIKECDIKVQQVLDRSLEEKLDREQTMDAIKTIIKEMWVATDDWNSVKVAGKEMMATIHGMPRENLDKCRKHTRQTGHFSQELLAWSEKMLFKIAEDSIQGEMEKRNVTSAFLRAMIHAFEQSNLVDLMEAVDFPP